MVRIRVLTIAFVQNFMGLQSIPKWPITTVGMKKIFQIPITWAIGKKSPDKDEKINTKEEKGKNLMK